MTIPVDGPPSKLRATSQADVSPGAMGSTSQRANCKRLGPSLSLLRVHAGSRNRVRGHRNTSTLRCETLAVRHLGRCR